MSKLGLQNVKKAFGGVLAVDGASLEFAEGKVSALIGPNGAGKTTIFNLISGLLCPTEGDVYYDGKKISGLAPWRISQLGVGRLFQDVRVFDRLTVRDNISVAFKGQKGENAIMSIIKRREVGREEQALRGRVEALLESVGLAGREDELAVNLSYGQQKLALARLVAADMDVLLLDEPTAGVNPRMVDKILELVRKVVGEGKTVIIIEHNMNVVREHVDFAFFMNEGRVALSGEPNAVLNTPQVKTAYLGM
jgi:ABC-type branched-subunit amino acid transport system ATPase component